MDVSLIVMSVIGVLIGSALVISCIDKHKHNVLHNAWAHLKDLVDVMDSIGLDKEYMDRYAVPDLIAKIKIIQMLIRRSNEKMEMFIELNKHVKFINNKDALEMKHTYDMYIDNIQMSLNSIRRSIQTYGVNSDRVYELIKRRDRMMIITSDGLRIVISQLKRLLDEYNKK